MCASAGPSSVSTVTGTREYTGTSSQTSMRATSSASASNTTPLTEESEGTNVR